MAVCFVTPIYTSSEKRPLISDHIKGPLVAAFRSPLMKALDRSVETLGLWIVTSSVTFIKSANQCSIKLCLVFQVLCFIFYHSFFNCLNLIENIVIIFYKVFFTWEFTQLSRRLNRTAYLWESHKLFVDKNLYKMEHRTSFKLWIAKKWQNQKISSMLRKSVRIYIDKTLTLHLI